MKHLLSLCCVAASSALLASSAQAEDIPQTNVFKADMSNPDLAAAITSFQDVCLPFIAHKTELPQSLNMEHYVKLLSQQGYMFKNRASEEAIIHTKWKSEPLPYVPGSLSLAGPIMRKVDKTTVLDTDNYVSRGDKRQTVSIGWNYPSQNHPGKSCEIRLDDASIPAESFEADFLRKDPDWRQVAGDDSTWSQCTIDGPDEFEFTAENRDGHLSLSVRRNDFFEPKLCDTKG